MGGGSAAEGGVVVSGWTPHGVAAAGARGEPPFPEDLALAAGDQEGARELLYLGWEMARLAGPRPQAERRALALLAFAVLAAQREGSTRLPLTAGEAGGGSLASLLGDLGATAGDAATAAELLRRVAATEDAGLAQVIGTSPGDYRPLLLLDGGLYSQRLWELERRVAESLGQRLPPAPRRGARAEPALAAAEAALAAVEARPPAAADGGALRLSDEQRRAVLAALAAPLAVVTGGPGTGKTSIVVTLLRALARLGQPMSEVALAAPTGKAADRLLRALQESLARIADPSPPDLELRAAPPPASTLHRLLGYSPAADRFRHHRRNPLTARLVVVDEASMVDLALADRLLRALPPDGRLVLLGDADQLPSVEAGAVFRDLVVAARRRSPGAVVELTRSYRMQARGGGGEILELAGRIRRGEPVERVREAMATAADADSLRLAGAELLQADDAAVREGFLRRWERELARPPEWRELTAATYAWGDGGFADQELARLRRLFALLDASRVLCVTRGSGGAGAAAINRWFHLRGHGPRGPVGGEEPGVGEPVMVTRNDYRRGLFNGDQGVVLAVRFTGEETPRPAVAFPRHPAPVAFPLGPLRDLLELAWATTVHKAQGSEHDRVALLLPDRPVRVLSRELLYTAVTRARQGAVVVGGVERLAEALARPLPRHSGLAERLLEGAEPPRPVAGRQLDLPL
ncbi:MAG TPA: exodeoxyribonuclease V subunit alpha [Thermoanaerobaculia bacterium]|nr:exodeoxyribonuclease V subunit alpha [Thermoanaerobaculia bacterium]